MKPRAPECAIIGFAARYPGRRDVEEFWQELCDGASFIAPMSESRRRLLRRERSRAEPMHGVFLDDLDCFDRRLFSLSPPGAMFADPRQRLLLESCWGAIEDAGRAPSALSGRKVGVFIAQDAWYWGAYADTGHGEYADAQEFILPGNNPSFLANRISSVFGFHGPSLAFNTTCSSVYVAIHHACASLGRGECDYALVGGITVFHTPPLDRFESPTNTMRSFAADADGYVSSEGCGAFLLCRNGLEVERRHAIHAVVCASECNSGGKTNSFAQPSHAQLIALLLDTLESGGVAAAQIDYVEAHGIASPMGDAIEANALLDVLGDDRRGAPCAVSTIKPSYGHAHAASGVYSLIKAILALRDEIIPAIHEQDGRAVNADVRAPFDGLRFLTQPAAWPAGDRGDRRALLLSYGFSNVNAALVVRGAAAQERPAAAPDGEVVVCLSARSESQLATGMEHLSRAVDRELAARNAGRTGRFGLADVAYTLQVGREAFSHRWATVVATIEQLSDRLAASRRGDDPDRTFRGVVRRKKPSTTAPKRDPDQLAALWAAGAKIDWADRYGDEPPRLVHLPIYPFARERYWLPDSDSDKEDGGAAPNGPIARAGAPNVTAANHPLLRRTGSDSGEARYSARLTGSEFFLTDHKVRGRPVLPGAAYLELVQAAFRDMIGGGDSTVCLHNGTWLRPLVMNGAPADLHIRIVDRAATEADPARYEVYTTETGGHMVHAEGLVTAPPMARPPKLDVKSIRATMTRGVVGAQECYAIFRRMGLDYGPAHRGIDAIQVGDEQALAALTLDPELHGQRGSWVLHPGILDSALQAFIGVHPVIGGGDRAQVRGEPELLIPFGLEELAVFRPLPAAMYAWVRRSVNAPAGRGHKFDLDLCADDGEVCARLRGFSLRAWQRPTSPAEGPKPASAIRAPRTAPGSVDGNSVAARIEELVLAAMAATLRLPVESIATDTAFKEFGMDSLLASTVTAALDRHLGPLPRTLFFEYENIDELVGYLAANRGDKLASSPTAGASKTSGVIDKADVVPGTDLHRQLEALGATRYQNSVLFDMWPQLYLSASGRGCLHFVERQGRVLATGTGYARVNPGEGRLVEEFAHYCAARDLQLCYLSIAGELDVDVERRCELLCLPVGCYQTIESLPTFSLEGRRMQRLRYMVRRFRKHAEHRTVEYPGGDSETDDAIRAVMLEWSRPKQIVSNVESVLRDLEEGRLTERYRVFLTYLGSSLQNVIMILPIAGGHLMDQEYYLPTMPLGGTESAVVSIIERLREEGESRFSLGLTWRRFHGGSGREFSDRDGAAFLADSTGLVANMLDHGEQNHQHKRKYRPSEEGVYLYRPKHSEPTLIRSSLSEFVSTGMTARELEQRIRESSARPTAKPPASEEAERGVAPSGDACSVRLDLISDSWTYHDKARFVRDRMARLHAGLAETDASADHERAVLGGLPCVFTLSGRLAERLLFRSLRGERKKILQNIPFETTRHNALSAGFVPIGIPDPRALDPESSALFRGGLDVAKLERLLAEDLDEIAMVFLELCNNGSGGYPVPLAQIRQVAQMCRDVDLPLVMDTTRIARNAELMRRFDDECAGRDVWDLVDEIAGYASHVVGSLCKDFAINLGGIIATRDDWLLDQIKLLGQFEGGLATGYYARLMAAAARDRDHIAKAVRQQLDLSAEVHEQLIGHGVPVVAPGGGHCALIRADELPGFERSEDRREALLQRLLSEFGIRGMKHLAGDVPGTFLTRCVRLAIPVGLPTEGVARQLASSLAALVDPRPAQATRDRASGERKPRAARRRGEPAAVAIIGMSGRYPAANDLQQYWHNLVEGVDSIQEIPPQRWDWAEHYHPDPRIAVDSGKSYSKWGGFVDDVDRFDPLFFGIAPVDAEAMDPQERLFLQACWTAFEDAGYSTQRLPETLRRTTAVFGGVTNSALHGSDPSSARPTSFARLVNLVSYALDLHGPSIPIDNLCASALVAIHEACEYIRTGRGEMALAGAVNLNLDATGYARRSREGLLARDRRARAFGAGGAGYIPGEGVGAFVLKRLPSALRDGDDIYAIIRGSAVNHSGRMNAFGVANPKQQAAVIRQAIEAAGVDPRSISYIETAASGVELGDALELAALASAHGNRTGCEGAYRMGSVKPNIGHCEAAAGMSQVTKAVLSLKHQMLAPTLSADALNPNVDFERFPFGIQREAAMWQRVWVDGREVPRRAGVTAVSAAGVNAHLILEEPGAIASQAGAGARDAPAVFVLSAIGRKPLERYATRWLNYFRSPGPKPSLDRIAYTTQVGRDAMRHRLAVVASNAADLTRRLSMWCEAGRAPGTWYGDVQAPSPQATSRLDPRDPGAVAHRWVCGEAIHWESMSDGVQRPAATLPTYPFARRACGGAVEQPRRERRRDAAPTAANSAIDGVQRVRQAVHELLRQVLGLRSGDEFDDRTSFSELGLDSLKLATLVEGLNRRFDVALARTAPFDHPNVQAMSEHLTTLLARMTPTDESPRSAVETILRTYQNREAGFQETLKSLEDLV